MRARLCGTPCTGRAVQGVALGDAGTVALPLPRRTHFQR